MAPAQQTGFLFFSIMHNIGWVFSVIKKHVGKKQENQHFNSTESQQLRATNAEQCVQKERGRDLKSVIGSWAVWYALDLLAEPPAVFSHTCGWCVAWPGNGWEPNKSWMVNFYKPTFFLSKAFTARPSASYFSSLVLINGNSADTETHSGCM